MRDLAERQLMVMPVPEDAWSRALPDLPRGGFPAMIIEAFWISGPVVHLLRVDGFSLGPGGHGERSVVGHDRISLEQFAGYSYDLGPGEVGVTVDLVDGRQVDVPLFLIDSHLHGGPGGYGRHA